MLQFLQYCTKDYNTFANLVVCKNSTENNLFQDAQYACDADPSTAFDIKIVLKKCFKDCRGVYENGCDNTEYKLCLVHDIVIRT